MYYTIVFFLLLFRQNTKIRRKWSMSEQQYSNKSFPSSIMPLGEEKTTTTDTYKPNASIFECFCVQQSIIYKPRDDEYITDSGACNGCYVDDDNGNAKYNRPKEKHDIFWQYFFNCLFVILTNKFYYTNEKEK